MLTPSQEPAPDIEIPPFTTGIEISTKKTDQTSAIQLFNSVRSIVEIANLSWQQLGFGRIYEAICGKNNDHEISFVIVVASQNPPKRDQQLCRDIAIKTGLQATASMLPEISISFQTPDHVQ